MILKLKIDREERKDYPKQQPDRSLGDTSSNLDRITGYQLSKC